MNIKQFECLLRSFTTTILFLFVALNVSTASAINAAPFGYSETQPDGTHISLFPRGDEHYNWVEDKDGYTVVETNGRFEYAVRGPSGRLNANGMVVGRDNPRAGGLQKHTLPSAAIRAQSAKRIHGIDAAGSDASATPNAVAPLGTVKNLVVMIRFSDHVGRTLPSVSDVNTLFNAVGGDPSLAPTGSVRDVYFENSYGQMTLDSVVNPGIGGWIDVPNTEAYYANGQSGDSTLWQALKNALDQLDAVIDFNDYDTDNDGRIDSIAFIHSGYGAEWGGTDAFGGTQANRIWSHRWAIQPQWNSNDGVNVYDYHISPGVWGTSGSAIGRIGVISHETGHFFGLPDLYDTNGGGEGIGSWGMMANSWGFDGTQLHPPHFSAWSKIGLGWYTPTTISSPGEYLINQTETNAEVYRIDANFPSNEYLLIENRQSAGIESVIPQGGLAIWHIDDSITNFNNEGYPGQGGWPGNGNHYRVALLQADGNYNLEKGNNRGDGGDMYHASGISSIDSGTVPNTDAYQNGSIFPSGISITDISASGASMTFCYNGCGPQVEPLAPTLSSATATSSSSIDLLWVDNSDNETGFRVERSANGSSGWGSVGSTGTNATNFSDTGLTASTEYFYRIVAFNAVGDSPDSNIDSATTDTPPAFVDYVAVSQTANEGSVSGGFSNTHTDNGSVQSITETSSNGNPRRRRSSLSFKWMFSVASGNSMTLTANAWSSGSTDNDDFRFQWSDDNATFNNAFDVSSTSQANSQSVALPSNLSGNVWIRVIDTDNTQGNSALDTISVDYLVIRADNTPVTPPADPSGLSANAIAYNQVDLDWNDNASDETGYEVQRALSGGSFSTIDTLGANSNSYSDSGVSPLTSYDYRVRALKGATTSGFSNTDSATTPDQPVGAINLSANGFKVKGKHNVDLTWSGSSATNVDVKRGGSLITTTANDGFYHDNIGSKGGATYVYEVCDAGTSNCSNTVTVVF